MEEEHRNCVNILLPAEKETSRNVFQRFGGGTPNLKICSNVFRNYEASEEVEDKEAKVPRWIDMRSS